METNNKKHDSKNPTVAKLSKSILTKILRIMAKIVAVILLLVVLICGYAIYQTSYAPYHGKKFDREIWMSVAEPGCSKLVRCKMTADIVNNHLHKGMKKEEVEDLLGKIDHYFYCLEPKVKCTGYTLGSCSQSALGSLGTQNIYVCFDKDEKLISASRKLFPCSDQNTAVCFLREEKCSCPRTDETHNDMIDCETEKW